MGRPFVGGAISIVMALLFYGIAISEAKDEPGVTVRGLVEDGIGRKVENATVWLIPAADVAGLASKPIEIRKDSPNDEPLEDNLAANRGRYLNTRSNAAGEFSLAGVTGDRFFVYVEPADNRYLPGGDQSRKSLSSAELAKSTLKIRVSGNIPPAAAYVGTSACLECHDDHVDFKSTMHRNGIQVIGKPGKLQDIARFAKFNDGLEKLKAGTRFWFHGYDKTRGFDKYLISDKAPADPSKVSFTATFFKDADGTLKFRTENVRDPGDPPRVYPVELTYGGGVFKQRYLFRVGANLFPFVQYNIHGDDAHADRARKPWRDYHGDWLYNEETAKLGNPPQAKAFDRECASCHYNGYTLAKNAAGDYLAGAANDPGGEMDIDGDGVPNELNMGCENCHGAGSAHTKAPKSRKASTIVSPGKLSAERANMICGQCHSRPLGTLNNEQPVNADNSMMLPGTSRNTFLAQYTTREDAAAKDYWPDGLHSKSHHQQYTDFIKSTKYRNATHLVACSDCHDPHGKARFAHQMKHDPNSTGACTACHQNKVDMKQHLADKARCTVAPDKIACASCHNTKTMQTGAGLGKGMVGKDGKHYWVNDITSHLYGVPRKDNVGVKGVDPGKAMPIPYTHSCGTGCHDTSAL